MKTRIIQDRINQIESNLDAQYRLLGAAENGINRAQSVVAAEKYKMEIEQDIRPKIRDYEREYFLVLQAIASEVTFREADAQAVVDVISQEVGRVQQQSEEGLPDQVLTLLQKIHDKLNEPGVTADAKLKGTLSLLPPFLALSYEAQLDTENFCREHFPTFTNLLKSIKK